MVNTPLELTFIIPTYNRPESTRLAIESILNQDAICEIIVVDDASSMPFNFSTEMEYDSSVKIIRHEANKGPSAARNTGIRHATTELIALLDSDDVLIENTLRSRLDFAKGHFKKNKEGSKTVVGCGWKETTVDGQFMHNRWPNEPRNSSDFYSGCWFAPGSTIICERSLFTETVGFYDEKLKRLEDYDWFIRFGELGFEFICDQTVGVSIAARDKINSIALECAIDDILYKYMLIEDGSPEGGAKYNKMRGYLFLEKAVNAYIHGAIIKTIKSLLVSFFYKPRLKLHLSPGWKYSKTNNSKTN